MIFDSHAHYDDKQFADDRDGLLSSMGGQCVGRIVNVAANLESVESSLALARAYERVYAAVGIHPSEVACLNEDTFNWLEQQAFGEKVVAIGEIGLDYYWDKEKEVQETQRHWFIRQLELARERKLPVIIHSRDAAEDTMRLMKQYAQGLKGVIHCYSYSREMAEDYIQMGYYLGVGGVITFKNAKKLRQAVEAIPLERVLVETDCPYLAPEPNRGKRNDSRNLPYIINAIAEIKGVDAAFVERTTYENACRMYGLKITEG